MYNGLHLWFSSVQEDRSRAEAHLRDQKEMDSVGSKYEQHNRQISKEKGTKVGAIVSKEKRQGRNLASIQNHLEAAHSNQKMAKMAKESLEAEQMGKEMMDKMAVSSWLMINDLHTSSTYRIRSKNSSLLILVRGKIHSKVL